MSKGVSDIWYGLGQKSSCLAVVLDLIRILFVQKLLGTVFFGPLNLMCICMCVLVFSLPEIWLCGA